MVWLDPEAGKPRLSDFCYDVSWSELRTLDLFLYPVLLIDRLRQVRIRIDELHDLVRLTRTIAEFSLEQETVGVARVIVLFMGEGPIERADKCAEVQRERFGCFSLSYLIPC
jgi:hypothetical protein